MDESLCNLAVDSAEIEPLLTWMAREKTEGAIRLAESAEVLSPPAYMKATAEFIHNA